MVLSNREAEAFEWPEEHPTGGPVQLRINLDLSTNCQKYFNLGFYNEQ